MAPEVLRGGQYSFTADVWSYGVILWEIATQRRPDMLAGPQNLTSLEESSCPTELLEIMKKCKQEDADTRPYFSMIFATLSSSESNLETES